jgi:hypothetical protein
MPHTKSYYVQRHHARLNALGKDTSTPTTNEQDYEHGPIFCVLQYRNPAHEGMSLNQLCTALSKHFQKPSVLFKVSYCHLPSLGKRSSKSSKIHTLKEAPNSCVCHMIQDSFKKNGHLLCEGSGWVTEWPHAVLAANLLSTCGLSHVPVQACNYHDIVDEYSSVFGILVDLWGITFENLYTASLGLAKDACDHLICVAEDTIELESSMNALQQLCIISPSDKAASHPIFMCPVATYTQLTDMIVVSNEFVSMQPDFKTLLSYIQNILPSFPTPNVATCAVPRAMYKPHKCNYRLVIAYHHCFFTTLAKLLQDMTSLVYSLFQQVLWQCTDLLNQRFCMDIRLDNVVQDSLQAGFNIPKRVMSPYVYTCDIKSCYDVIPLDS